MNNDPTIFEDRASDFDWLHSIKSSANKNNHSSDNKTKSYKSKCRNNGGEVKVTRNGFGLILVFSHTLGGCKTVKKFKTKVKNRGNIKHTWSNKNYKNKSIGTRYISKKVISSKNKTSLTNQNIEITEEKSKSLGMD